MRRAIGSYLYGLFGIGFGINGTSGADLHAKTTWMEYVMSADPISIIDGKIFVYSIDITVIISILVGTISGLVVIIRLMTDLDTWLYKKRLKRLEEEMILKMTNKK